MAVFRILVVAMVGLTTLRPAQAFVLGGAIERQTGRGDFVKLDPAEGFAVGEDTFESDNLFAFDEDQNIVLDRDIRVDIGGRNGIIEQGVVVASHYVFFDSFSGAQFGYVDFDSPVLGVAVTERTMRATDFLANTAVTYLSPYLRGLEFGDGVRIDPENPFRIWVSWAASSPGDYVRVFTARSPGV